ncbi:MAG: hypothetical protein NT139_01695 [Candidatus Woesearchaeota archaeon]|nr:hypothetical protein [Candidatus Woesearchaeota archaeon]
MPNSNDLKILEKNIKNSFSKLKEDIEFIKDKTKSNEISLNLIKKDIEDISSKIKVFSLELDHLKDELHEKDISSGNKGVPRQTDDRQTTDRQPFDSQVFPEMMEPLKKEIEEIFSSFTKQELKVFLAIYNLEKIKENGVTYQDISQNLGLTQSCIRDHINELILKKAPIDKIKTTNQKILLFINKKFKSFEESTKFIQNFNKKNNQTTLF